MHTVDVLAVCIAVLVVLVCAAVLARQRYMLRLAGGQPVAFQVGGRWVYGIVRYARTELLCYRAFGIGTRPTAVLDRAHLRIVSSRAPLEVEHNALPANAVVVECRNADRGAVLAFSESGFTGFVSWLEASAPRS